MSQWSVSAVTPDNTLCGDNWCHLVDQLDAPVLIHIPLGIDEARIAVIILVEHLLEQKILRNENNVCVIASYHAQLMRQCAAYLASVCNFFNIAAGIGARVAYGGQWFEPLFGTAADFA